MPTTRSKSAVKPRKSTSGNSSDEEITFRPKKGKSRENPSNKTLRENIKKFPNIPTHHSAVKEEPINDPDTPKDRSIFLKLDVQRASRKSHKKSARTPAHIQVHKSDVGSSGKKTLISKQKNRDSLSSTSKQQSVVDSDSPENIVKNISFTDPEPKNSSEFSGSSDIKIHHNTPAEKIKRKSRKDEKIPMTEGNTKPNARLQSDLEKKFTQSSSKLSKYTFKTKQNSNVKTSAPASSPLPDENDLDMQNGSTTKQNSSVKKRKSKNSEKKCTESKQASMYVAETPTSAPPVITPPKSHESIQKKLKLTSLPASSLKNSPHEFGRLIPEDGIEMKKVKTAKKRQENQKSSKATKISKADARPALKGAIKKKRRKDGKNLTGLHNLTSKASRDQTIPERGVLYLGHIPHGFYEDQMKTYFEQFGTVTRLKLARSKKTGASKGYAFIEFESEEIASIVAEVMNGYLMYGRILVAKVVPHEKVFSHVFKGAQKKLFTVPWQEIHRKNHNALRNTESVKKLKKLDHKKLQKTNKKFHELGIDYEFAFTSPALNN